ncbi:MAG: hypothetical protein GQ474_01165 [Sulfurimonas sp.]|nr:hypothetical protein [Sulfurimonas sp.]
MVIFSTIKTYALAILSVVILVLIGWTRIQKATIESQDEDIEDLEQKNRLEIENGKVSVADAMNEEAYRKAKDKQDEIENNRTDVPLNHTYNI